MFYAVLDPANKIVIAIDQVEHLMSGNDRVRVPSSDLSIIGKKFTGTIDDKEHNSSEFQVPEKTMLVISLDKDIVESGAMVNATAEVRDQDGSLAPINGSYFVPIVRNTDKWTAKLLEVVFNNGQATSQFNISEPGIYTIRMDLIRPIPDADLATPPELIVKETG